MNYIDYGCGQKEGESPCLSAKGVEGIMAKGNPNDFQTITERDLLGCLHEVPPKYRCSLGVNN